MSHEFYADHYRAAQRSGLQGFGNGLIDRAIEWRRPRGAHEVLEVGASSGEHLRYVKRDTFRSWTCLDLMPGVTDPRFAEEIEREGIRFVQGDVENIPFRDESFDEVVSTCLLHHIGDPESGLREMRRVLRVGGRLTLALPTDPGALNRAVKVLVTYRQMLRAGVENPRLQYAREHRNHVGALLTQIRATFSRDRLSFVYLPFGIPSWNANLMVVVSVQRQN